METEHTPGPWEIVGPHFDIYRVQSSDYVCQASKAAGDWREGNARLIAAAPDLLEALRRIAGGNIEGLGDSLLQGNATSAVFILQSFALAAIRSSKP